VNGPSDRMSQTEAYGMALSWTEVSDLATANTQQGEAGSSAAGLVSGGVNSTRNSYSNYRRMDSSTPS
jgi:hypothetical protein